MSNPEFIAQRCDACTGWLHHDVATDAYKTSVPGTEPSFFRNHSEAHRHARAAGWYIAEVDLCPACVEQREVPDGD